MRYLYKFQRITSGGRFIPEIDGLRFLAIVTVIGFHSFIYFSNKTTITKPEVDTWWMRLCQNGYIGVMLFFAISGFVLALPFAQWHLNGGRKVFLKDYFMRRLTRLEPPYLLVLLLVSGMLIGVGKNGMETFRHFLASAVYAHNFIYRQPSTILGVAWSLEIEVQFYMLAPLLFKTFTIKRQTSRYLLYTACILFFSWFSYHNDPETSGFKSLPGYFQYFCAGIFLADWYIQKPIFLGSTKQTTLWPYYSALILGVGLLFFLLVGDLNHSLPVRMAYPFVIMGFYGLVLHHPLWQKIFSYPIISIIGGMCYSIYLWHYIVISSVGSISMHWNISDSYTFNFCLQLLLFLCSILLVSACFFYFVEKPCMKRGWHKGLFAFKTTYLR